jgi:hypothetical protein
MSSWADFGPFISLGLALQAERNRLRGFWAWLRRAPQDLNPLFRALDESFDSWGIYAQKGRTGYPPGLKRYCVDGWRAGNPMPVRGSDDSLAAAIQIVLTAKEAPK